MTQRIPNTFIQDLLARTDIIEVIQPRVTLTKKGQNHQARCPFHDEKTPSFSVNQQKQFYYCFGCGASGNAIGFLMNFDRMEFRDAVQYLAAQHGMEVPTQASDETRSHTKLYPLMEKAAHCFVQQLKNTPIAIDYLKSRGLTGHTAKNFLIGYASDAWDFLEKQLARTSEDRNALISCGLLIQKDNARGLYDRFRHRITFPIRDVRGRIVGFGGRSLDNEQMPKYLNSPETPIFHKSQELYGLYEARQANRTLEQVLIVEGYMDVVSLAQQGITFSVATLGTATTPKHIQKLLRYTSTLVFCFDGDRAGKKAAWKALTLSLPLLRDGIHLRFLFLPDGEDPDSLVKKIGHDAFLALINNASSLADVFFDSLSAQYNATTIEGRADFAKAANDTLKTMPQGIYQQLLTERLAKTLNLAPGKLNDLQHPSPQQPTHTQKRSSSFSTAARACALLLKKPSLAVDAAALPIANNAEDPAYNLLTRLMALFKATPDLPIGSAITCFENEQLQKAIIRLAAQEFPMDEAGITAEFEGALHKIQQQHTDQIVKNLINRAKLGQLSSEEKMQLQQLIKDKQT